MKLRHMFARPLGILALGLVLLGGSFFFTPVQAHAMSLRQEINALKATIESLRSSLGASVYKTTATSDSVSATAPIVVTTDVSAATVTSLKLGSKSDDVKKLQEKLFNLGYYKGIFDGSYGKGTAEAVKAYQAAKGLTADGSAGPKTLAPLGITLSASTPASVKPAITPGTTVTLPNLGPVTPGGPIRKCLPTGEPWIQITLPDGGEVYSEGDTILVKWRTCRVPADTELPFDIYNQAEQLSVNYNTGVSALSATGTVNYTIPIGFLASQGWNDGQYYNMHIKSGPVPYNGDYIAVEDFSDGLFTINGSSGDNECDPEDALSISADPNWPIGFGDVVNGKLQVLKFSITNQTDCDIELRDMRAKSLSTDGIRYFTHATVMRPSGNIVSTEPIDDSPTGQDLTLSLDDEFIDAGETENFILRFDGYQQPVWPQGLGYSDYRWKHILVGVTANDIDAVFVDTNENLHMNTEQVWFGKVIRINPMDLQ